MLVIPVVSLAGCIVLTSPCCYVRIRVRVAGSFFAGPWNAVSMRMLRSVR